MKPSLEHFDRVRRNTAPSINARIDACITENVRFYSTQERACISRRIEELDAEWDIERILQVQAPAIAFSGLALSLFTGKRAWLALPAVVLPFLFLHGVQGWCPPVPLLRRLGVRTRGEIDREKYALKVLRGDFDGISPQSAAEAEKMPRAVEALNAVSCC